MNKNITFSEGEEDLRIVDHLEMHKLPESLQSMLSLATTPEEQDIILMATLATASACVPEIKPLDQRKVLFEQLPNEYPSKVLVTEAQSQGISRRTAIRWNEKWQSEGLVQLINMVHIEK